MPLDSLLTKIENDRRFAAVLAHHRKIPPLPARCKHPKSRLSPKIRRGLSATGIRQLYSHQAQAVDLAASGRNVVAVTPTASGKTLLYNLPVLEELSRELSGHAIYLFPLKALEQDQAKKLKELLAASGLQDEISVGIYDGDTPSNDRARMRSNPPNILITNPDMLHLSLMSYHASWEAVLRNLRYVVLDELHIYRGVFGSNILHLLHRLIRLCSYYGCRPQFIATSATIAGARELAQELTGLTFDLVDESGAPASTRHFLFFNPIESYLTFSLILFRTALAHGLKTIVFTKARRTTELLHLWLNQADPRLARKVSSYRAGFLTEERRNIEQQLRTGRMDGVISTSALELGIDIGGLDVCILVGYPGTIATTWQRGGRVGRGSSPAAICLVAGQDLLDQYFMRHPDDFFQRPVEKAVVDSGNTYIAKPHILCAAQEVPISEQHPLWNPEYHQPVVESLASEGRLLLSANGDRWFSSMQRPHRDVDIRAGGDQFLIELDGTRQRLGVVSGRSVYSECHPGAIYLHHAEMYHISSLNISQKRATADKTNASYYTNALFEKETEIIEILKEQNFPAGTASLNRLKVTEQLVGYQKRRFNTQELISQHDLDFPPSSYETVGIALAVPVEAADLAREKEFHFRGGIHGVEHAMLALSPLFALCDRNDMGGYSQASHHQLNGPAIFLYDGHPGGIGLSARMFDVFMDLTERTYKLIAECPCEFGCPSCIHSPKCGHGNVPLDKAAAILTLEVILGKQDYTQKRILKKASKVEPSMKKKAEEFKSDESPRIPRGWLPDLTGVVFDLETQRSADEVGGWNNIRAMGLAWAVIYRFPAGDWLDFEEKDAGDLVQVLSDADLVVGFNHIRFDYEVLRGYSGYDFQRLPNYDMLVEVQRAIGHRLKLDSLTSATLGARKTADGLQSLRWWKNGEVEKVAEYCRKDVEVTRDLFFHILENDYLLFEKRGIGLVRAPLPASVPLQIASGKVKR